MSGRKKKSIPRPQKAFGSDPGHVWDQPSQVRILTVVWTGLFPPSPLPFSSRHDPPPLEIILTTEEGEGRFRAKQVTVKSLKNDCLIGSEGELARVQEPKKWTKEEEDARGRRQASSLDP